MAVHAGRLVLIKIDLNGVGGAGANWVTVGQQRGGGTKKGSETADSTHKGDDGWPSAVITRTPWSISCDGALDPLDSALAYLETSWAAKTKVYAQIDKSALSGGTKKEGRAIITDFSDEYPEGDVVTFTLELQGDGALSTSP